MRKILCLLTVLVVWTTCQAQDVMARINEIKLQGGHLTAQYSHEVADSAFMMCVRDILHQLNLKGYGLFTMNELLPKIGHLDVPRGGMFRVFCYLKMSDMSKKDDSNVQRERITIKPKFDVNESNDQSASAAAAIPLQPAPSAPPTPQQQRVEADVPQTKMAVDIMAQRDLTAAMNILKAKKNAGIIRAYGPFAKGTNLEEVYLAIFDRTTSVPLAVLSPTVNGKRTNLISKTDDSLSNYHGCKGIWISF